MFWFGLILMVSGILLWLGPLNPDGLPTMLGAAREPLAAQLRAQRPLHVIVFIPGLIVLAYHFWGRGYITRYVDSQIAARRGQALQE